MTFGVMVGTGAGVGFSRFCGGTAVMSVPPCGAGVTSSGAVWMSAVSTIAAGAGVGTGVSFGALVLCTDSVIVAVI